MCVCVPTRLPVVVSTVYHANDVAISFVSGYGTFTDKQNIGHLCTDPCSLPDRYSAPPISQKALCLSVPGLSDVPFRGGLTKEIVLTNGGQVCLCFCVCVCVTVITVNANRGASGFYFCHDPILQLRRIGLVE